MKKLLLIAAALLVVSVGVAYAKGSSLAWNNCDGATTNPGAPFVTFDCTQGNGTVYSLFQNFQLDAALTGIDAAQGIVDMTMVNDANVPDWWQIFGGCNDGSLGFAYVRGSFCGGNSNTFCGTTLTPCSGAGPVAEFIGGTPAYPSAAPNKARFILVLARASTSPVTLAAGKHYLWEMDILIDNPNAPNSCAGCGDAATFTADNLDIFDINSNTTTITSADAGNPSACANQTVCNAVAVQSKTWGQLKALYR